MEGFRILGREGGGLGRLMVFVDGPCRKRRLKSLAGLGFRAPRGWERGVKL